MNRGCVGALPRYTATIAHPFVSVLINGLQVIVKIKNRFIGDDSDGRVGMPGLRISWMESATLIHSGLGVWPNFNISRRRKHVQVQIGVVMTVAADLFILLSGYPSISC